jgi:uncharacterized protein
MPSAAAAELASELAALATQEALEGKVENASDELPQHDAASGIVLMVAQRCNLSCVYCYGNGGTYGTNGTVMSPSVARGALDLLERRGRGRRHLRVVFFGGEPLLALPLVRDVVAECQRRGMSSGASFDLSVTTNGTLLTDAVVAFLADHRFKVMVSLDGPARFHDSVRRYKSGRPTFSVVARGIRKLVAAGVPCELRATLMPGMESRASLDEVMRTAEDLGARALEISPVDQPRDRSTAAARLSNPQLRQLARSYLAIAAETFAKIASGDPWRPVFDPLAGHIRSFLTGRRLGAPCGACFGMTAVSAGGELYPCHRFVGLREYKIGSVSVGVDLEAVAGFVRKARAAWLPRCGKCWARRICRQPCYFHTADGRGGFVAPDSVECTCRRLMIKHAAITIAMAHDAGNEIAGRYFRALFD